MQGSPRGDGPRVARTEGACGTLALRLRLKLGLGSQKVDQLHAQHEPALGGRLGFQEM